MTDNAAAAAAPATMVRQPSLLANLPCELLNKVASYIPTAEFNSMRLTCKEVENKLFDYWANSFFKKKQFMISALSLQTLVNISKHETLAARLAHLVIGLDHLSATATDPTLSVEEQMKHSQLSHAQKYILDTGDALKLLCEALPNLPNLRTLDMRDFNSYTRYRDQRINGVWTSYGYSESPYWARVVRSFSAASLVDSGNSEFARRVFTILLVALDRCNKEIPIRSLEVLLRNDRGVALTDGAFALFPGLGHTGTKLLAVLSRLTKLHLTVEVGGYNATESILNAANTPSSASEANATATANLRRFLALATNVTWLRLNFKPEHHGHGDEAPRLLTWLSLDPDELTGWTDINPKPISPPLRRLDLGHSVLTAKTFARLFKKFDRLESCSLRRIHMGYGPTQHPIVGSAADDENHRCEWARAFRQLHTLAPNLKHLSAAALTEGSPLTGSELVIFAPTQKGDTTKHEIQLSKVNRAALKELADATWTLSGLNRAQISGNSEGSQDDESVIGSDDQDEQDVDVGDEDGELDEDDM